eukprot:gene13855-15303_t
MEGFFNFKKPKPIVVMDEKEKTLDHVRVNTPPLYHVTKSRVKNTTRKVSIPSRQHLKRSSVTDISLSNEDGLLNSTNMTSNTEVKLKLPPPPVAKKPKLKPGTVASNGQSDKNGKSSGEDVFTAQRFHNDGMNNARKKPDILPKPVVGITPGASMAPVTDDVIKKIEALKVTPNINKQQQERENGQGKPSLSFSERLKATSLSRRTEQVGSDNMTATKLRSQIISPVRRGSRSFMNIDSPQDRPTRPVFELFKRLSTESKLLESTDSREMEEPLSITAELDKDVVQPLSVDSALFSNEDEEDVTADSFDTSELNTNLQLEFSMVKNKGPHADSNSENSVEPKPVHVNGDRNGEVGPFVETMVESCGTKPSIISGKSLQGVEEVKQNLQGTVSLSGESENPESAPLPEKKQNTVGTGRYQEDESSQLFESQQASKFPASIFSNARRLKNLSSRDAGNHVRRKFKPIGSEDNAEPVLSANVVSHKVKESPVAQDEKVGMVKKDDRNRGSTGLIDLSTREDNPFLGVVVPPPCCIDEADGAKDDEGHASTENGIPDVTAATQDDEIPIDVLSGFELGKFPGDFPAIPPPPPPVDIDSDDEDIIDPPTVYQDEDELDDDELAIPPIISDDIVLATDDVELHAFLESPVGLQSGVSSGSAAKFSFGGDETKLESTHVLLRNKSPILSNDKEFQINFVKDGMWDELPEISRSLVNEEGKAMGKEDDHDSKIEMEEQKEAFDITPIRASFDALAFDDGADRMEDSTGDDIERMKTPRAFLFDNAGGQVDMECHEDSQVDNSSDEEDDIAPCPPPFPSRFLPADALQLDALSDGEDHVPSTQGLPDNASPDLSSDFLGGDERIQESLSTHNFNSDLESENVTMENSVNIDFVVDEPVGHRLDSLADQTEVNAAQPDVSEGGRERRRSFQRVRDRKGGNLTGGELQGVESGEGYQEIVQPPTEDFNLFYEPETSIEDSDKSRNNYMGDSVRSYGGGVQDTEKNLSVTNDGIRGDLDDYDDEILDVNTQAHSEDMPVPSTSYSRLDLESFPSGDPCAASNELEYSSDKSKLGLAVSQEPSTEVDANRLLPSQRSSTFEKVLGHKEIERSSSNVTWSSFSSSDEDCEDEKPNIVKMMKERSLSQDGFVDDHIQLSFPDDLERKYDESVSEGDKATFPVDTQDDSMHNFENLLVEEWSADDVGDWLEMIGFRDLRHKFEDRRVGGQDLLEIDFQLLDEMGISNAEDRELILSEIYALKNPEDVDTELSLYEALDNASGYEREKMLAVLEALYMPSEDSDNRYLPPSPSPKLSPRNKKISAAKSKATNKDNYRRALSECLPTSYEDGNDDDYDSEGNPVCGDSPELRSKSASPTRRRVLNSLGMSLDAGLSKENDAKSKKTSKKRSFLNAFSFRRKGLGKLFHSRKKLVDSSLKYLLQASPQGVVRVLAHKSEVESTFVPLLVTVTTTAVEITKTVLEKLEIVEDPNCFYIVQAHSSKSVPEVKLGDDECPLVLQCRWPDAERYRFEMKKKSDGSVIIVHKAQGSNEERSVKIETTLNTNCEGIMSIALKKLQLNEPVSHFSLISMKSEKNRQTTEESQIPLEVILLGTKKNLSKPTVYRLIRTNFIGSPEELSTQDSSQLEIIETLQEQVGSLNNQLQNSTQIIYSKDKEIADLKEECSEREKVYQDKDEEIASLRQLVETLESEVGQLNSGGPVVESNAVDEKLMVQLKENEDEIKLMQNKIRDLENILHVKDVEIRGLKTTQSSKHEDKQPKDKDFDIAKVLTAQHSADIEMLENENKSTMKAVEELQGLLDEKNREIDRLVRAQHENELLSEKVVTLERITSMKDKQLQEMKNIAEENEELQGKLLTLERTVKQKERAAKEATSSQSVILELRRTVDGLQNEVTGKELELESSQQELIELREKLNEDIESKINTIANLMTETQEMRSQMSETAREKQELRMRTKDLEILAEERRRKIDELGNVHEQYKGQHQKIKKLERELILRNDELQQFSNDKEASFEDLRNHIESLEQSLLDKGSTILNLEFKLQKVERRLKESEDATDEEIQEKNKLNFALEDMSQKSAELNKRLDNHKRLLAEKDKQIQATQESKNRVDEKLKADLNAAQIQLTGKDRVISQLKLKLDQDKMELKSHFATLQELAASKETKWKERELQMNKEKEDSRLRTTQLEARINEKEATIRKLEAKVAKLESMGRENMRKFEKFMSDKDRMLKQVKEDSDADIKGLKDKIRRLTEAKSESEKHIRQLSRSSSLDQSSIAVKLKQKDEENKQNKYLLERLMSVVNEKDPGLLEHFENSFDISPEKQNDQQPLLHKVDDDWC